MLPAGMTDAVRTPEEALEGLPDFPFAPRLRVVVHDWGRPIGRPWVAARPSRSGLARSGLSGASVTDAFGDLGLLGRGLEAGLGMRGAQLIAAAGFDVDVREHAVGLECPGHAFG